MKALMTKEHFERIEDYIDSITKGEAKLGSNFSTRIIQHYQEQEQEQEEKLNEILSDKSAYFKLPSLEKLEEELEETLILQPCFVCTDLPGFREELQRQYNSANLPESEEEKIIKQNLLDESKYSQEENTLHALWKMWGNLKPERNSESSDLEEIKPASISSIIARILFIQSIINVGQQVYEKIEKTLVFKREFLDKIQGLQLEGFDRVLQSYEFRKNFENFHLKMIDVAKNLASSFFKHLPPSKAQAIELFVQSKKIVSLAERTVQGDARDYTLKELAMLGGLSYVVEGSTIYDDGSRTNPKVHEETFLNDFIISSAPLLTPIKGQPSLDMERVLKDKNEEKGKEINKEDYQVLLKERMLPGLVFANCKAADQGKGALITTSILGGGYFAGEFIDAIPKFFVSSNITMIRDNKESLKNIKLLYVFSYKNDMNLTLDPVRVRDTGMDEKPKNIPELCPSEDYKENSKDNFSNCTRTNFVPGDLTSWPSNEGNRNIRAASNEPPKMHGSNALTIITGFPGAYDSEKNLYLPEGYPCWEKAILDQNLQLKVKDILIYDEGAKQFFKLEENKLVPYTFDGDKVSTHSSSSSSSSSSSPTSLSEDKSPTGKVSFFTQVTQGRQQKEQASESTSTLGSSHS